MPTTRLTLGDYSAWVKVAGEEVEHHSIEVNEEKKLVSCWIASEEGKAFTIDVEKLQVNYPCVFYLFVDGNFATGRVFPAKRIKPLMMSGTPTGLDTEKPFLFSLLELTDDDSLLASSQSAKDIGEIKIDVHRASNLQDFENPSFNRTVFYDNKKVHERAKKATEHRVISGEEVKVAPVRIQNITTHEQVAKFIFRYRSSRMLQANGLIARKPSPVEEPTSGEGETRKRKSEVKEESEDEEEDTEEVEARREEAELLARLESIRNARDARNQTKPPKKKIKEEPRPAFMRGEIIDLT
ncbi:hypothetical protein NLJ89_g1031 [Agrocybe chaxingu]|uniref:DUF7918 domain-containing protein n=1 Tax=Agrocybe chaxingu TaxID=84603 RepID=A0A9W8N0W0_9AGAR|nr:hypothetical protein NLJ89_g1031 [Agrocybe chaxingu]